jgi:[ribosomal protein S5]-alanine N-acetyltransferase
LALKNKVLRTKRFDLEPLTEGHARFMLAGLQDPQLYTYTAQGPPRSLSELQKRYKRLERRTSPDGKQVWLNWAIKQRGRRSYLGYVQATLPTAKCAIIGYVVFRQFWRKGVATEAVSCALRELFLQYGISHAEVSIDPHNEASLALAASLGFKPLSKSCSDCQSSLPPRADQTLLLRRRAYLQRAVR